MAGASTFLKSKNLVFVKGSCLVSMANDSAPLSLSVTNPQGGQKDRVPLGKPFLNQTLERERLQRPLHPHREGAEAAVSLPVPPACPSRLSLLQLRKPRPRPATPMGTFASWRVQSRAWRWAARGATLPLWHSPTGPSRPTKDQRTLFLCYRRHSRKSSSATLHSSPVRNLLLSHSGNIFSNSKIVLALWGQKPA